jgi:hypothetical protein
MKNVLHNKGDLVGERYLIIEDIGQGGGCKRSTEQRISC